MRKSTSLKINKPIKPKISLKGLHKKAWSEWSKYRRNLGVNFGGFQQCFTCRRMYHWKEMDLGHYIHRRLDFDFLNTNPQCKRCNQHLHGNLGEYTLRLIDVHGREAVDDLKKRAFSHKGYGRDELKYLYDKYKNLNGRLL